MLEIEENKFSYPQFVFYNVVFRFDAEWNFLSSSEKSNWVSNFP